MFRRSLPASHRSSLGRLGVIAFTFFLMKGLAWLALPWLLLESVR